MTMKIGFQTIVWGPRVRNLEYMLGVIEAAGYEGVELFQRPEVLGSIDNVLRLLEKHHLKLIGLSGGSLTERMDFCGDFFRPDHLYVDTWNEEEACKAMDAGFTLGLHPHAYMPVGNLRDALAILGKHPIEKYPRLKFIADTAHLTVTHDGALNAIRQTKGRLVAVHLKDWNPEFGRSSFRYARGFAELGGGSVNLDAILRTLKKTKYEGWLIVEQDYTLTDPDTNTLASAGWLAQRDLLPPPPRQRRLLHGLHAREGREPCPAKREVLFSRQISRARLQGIGAWYENIAIAFRKLVPCKLVEVWSTPPKQAVMSLMAMKPDSLASTSDVSAPVCTLIGNRDDTLSGTTIERRVITHFDLTQEENVARFEHPELVRRLGLRTMVSLPIFNPWNFNHVRLVVNLFPRNENETPNDDELFRSSANVAFALDSALEDVCSASATKVNFEAGRCVDVKDFLNSLRELVRKTVGCQGVAVFLVNDPGDRLELKTTTGTTWMVPRGERYYRKGEGLTGSVWQSGDTFLTVAAYREARSKHKSCEGMESQERDDCLFVPLSKPTGKVIGVVRCRRKDTPQTSGKRQGILLFSDDDASVVESVVQSAVPHLEVLLAQERRAKALGRLTHELKVPVVAIRGAAEFMMRTPGVDKFFDYDYPGDICSWTELMARLIDNADIMRYSRKEMSMRAELTFLIPSIIAPAIKQVRLLLDGRGFLRYNIRYNEEGLGQIPRLWLDRNQFQQVVFNLLSNAIKYAYDDPSRFHIVIEGGEQGNMYAIRFRDWGPGIDSGMEELIFEEGVRGSSAVQKDVAGQGLGLWVARQIVERHKGRIEVTNLGQPTEFTILLPRWLRQRPPR